MSFAGALALTSLWLAEAAVLCLAPCERLPRDERHPWHETQAELDLRPERGLFEVAVRIDALELEQALSRRAGRRLSLDRTDEVAPQLEAWTRESFLARSAGGSWATLNWVGFEAEVRDAWIFFELILPPGPGPLSLSNQMLFERNAFQSNKLFVRAEDFGAVLVCEPGAPWATLSAVDLPPPPGPQVGWSVRLPPLPGTFAARLAAEGTDSPAIPGPIGG
ncbi:DUF6702 family protein [Engelhardtia mirabilis]|uniref:Uncharacterized protein n=1 Tax=Engelhardtia mirabilis TaxID=2528011 RepID=A0A518BMD6_9BACT|nr:hypothetical protein Pla133_32000 [Planctomycetes bacterium Pla133]QDV02432.1 hypothetical protein Pla86_31990 [Planctomycetes bacterium Pla86]